MSNQENEKEFYTIEEAATLLDWNRATVFQWMRDLGIKTYRFKRDRHSFIASADVARIRQVREKPWMAGEVEKREEIPV